MEGNLAGPDVDGAAAPLCHFKAVAQQGEAGDVRTAVDRITDHNIPGRFVQRGHLPPDAFQNRLLHQIRLGGRGQNAHAQGLGEDQRVPGPGAAVFQDRLGMHKAGYGQSVNGLCTVDRVPAGDDGPRLIGLGVASPQDLLHGGGLHPLRNTHDVQGQLGFRAHGVDVAHGIGRRDLPVKERIVHNGGEKVGGLDQRHRIADGVDAGVVALVVAHDQAGVLMGLKPLQHPHQRACADFGAAAGAGGQLGQFYFRFHPRTSFQLFSAR